MAMNIFPPSTTVHAGDVVNLPFYCSEPGTVVVTSSDETVATVAGSVVVAGSRAWTRRGSMSGGFNGPSGASAATQYRDNCTICFDIDAKYLTNQNLGSAATNFLPIAQSYSNGTATNLLNWMIAINYQRPTADLYRLFFIQSNTTSAGATLSVRNMSKFTGLCRVVVTLSGATVTVYWHDGASKQSGTVARTAPTGNVASPLLAIYAAQRFAYFGSILADDANGVDAWLAGNCPASPVVYYPCNEEVPLGNYAPHDASANVYDGIFSGDATYPLTSAPRDYTDTVPVVPFQPFTITPNSTGTFTIIARRRRQGIPDRATDEEKYETTSETFTITEMPAEVVQYVRLLITTSTQGTVDIASSDPSVVTFPSSIVVGPTLQYEVLGTVIGAGTSTITTSMGGAVLDTTTVTIEAEPTIISSGPPQNLRSRI